MSDKVKTFEEYVEQMIKDGYWSERDLAPLKCIHCDSKDLEDKNYSYEGMYTVSYERWCKDCNKVVNY